MKELKQNDDSYWHDDHEAKNTLKRQSLINNGKFMLVFDD